MDTSFQLFCINTSMITGSYDKVMFSFVRNCPPVFQSGCTLLHSHQQGARAPVAPQSLQHLLLSVFPAWAILMAVWWYLVVLICMSPMTYIMDYYFIWVFFAICMYSLGRLLFFMHQGSFLPLSWTKKILLYNLLVGFLISSALIFKHLWTRKKQPLPWDQYWFAYVLIFPYFFLSILSFISILIIMAR